MTRVGETPPDLEGLRALSDAATPGPWESGTKLAWPGEDDQGEYVSDIGAGDQHVVCLGHDYDDHGNVSVPDAAFIVAAANYVRAAFSQPATIVGAAGGRSGDLPVPTLDAAAFHRTLCTGIALHTMTYLRGVAARNVCEVAAETVAARLRSASEETA